MVREEEVRVGEVRVMERLFEEMGISDEGRGGVDVTPVTNVDAGAVPAVPGTEDEDVAPSVVELLV